ncbi:alpha/beta hydrolase [Paractinoplanes toevensis]|uniref:Esterase n=1 Tax=Paractinoplanes toevensis TaxID=571911 RepID=A0A919T879_9ACTN|nr:alpha/beta hydrolase fold domain-containing protein [Actinoplanes toevensis]GIM90658.1 esterase [Actinoplanes toevensis]
MELDPDLKALLAAMPTMPPLNEETLAQIRPYAAPPALDSPSVDRQEIDGPARLTILRPAGPAAATPPPLVFWIHGGGMVMGNRYSQLDIPVEWLERFGATVVSVEYRLAPEARGTELVEDCYRGLAWAAGNLAIDPARIVVAGASAGGGLAAGVTLMARDRGDLPIAGQVLIGAMLDHRNDAAFDGAPVVWTREMNEFGWRSVIDGGEVPAYVSPALAEDLSGLPPAYIDAGSAELFRDENVAYASRIWAAGGRADLHVWTGGSHGFDALFPAAPISVAARRARTDWVGRLLSGR